MNPNPEHGPLLNAVLLDPDWEGEVLGQVLHLAGRRRQQRRLQQAAGVAAVVVFGAVLGWSRFSPTRVRPDRGLALSALRTTHSITIVTTIPFRSSVPLVLPHYRLIGDEELLALAQERAGVLVQVGPGQERLIFP
jgi:hypothetical protein